MVPMVSAQDSLRPYCFLGAKKNTMNEMNRKGTNRFDFEQGTIDDIYASYKEGLTINACFSYNFKCNHQGLINNLSYFSS